MQKRGTRVLRKVVFLMLVGAMGLSCLWAIAEATTHVALARVEREGWPVEDESLHAAVASFRNSPTNAPARALEHLGRGLGLELRTFEERKGNPIPKEATNELTARYEDAKNYFSTVFANPTGMPSAPPAALGAYLARHVDTLDRVGLEVSEGPEPWWDSDTTKGIHIEIPGLVGHLQLSSFLAAQALEDRRHDRRAVAWERLRAVARLSDGLGRRPELLSQLISLVEARLVCAAMRKMEAPIPPWVTVWRANGYREALLRSFAVESNSTASLLHGIGEDVIALTYPEKERKPSVVRKLIFCPFTPYFRYAVINLLAAEKSVMNQLQASTDCSGREIVGPASLPKWNVFGKAVIKDVAYETAWRRAGVFESELYGSKLILAAKQKRAEDGHWPAERPAVPTSCDPEDWVYSVAGEGLKVLHPEPFIHADERTYRLAEEYTEGTVSE